MDEKIKMVTATYNSLGITEFERTGVRGVMFSRDDLLHKIFGDESFDSDCLWNRLYNAWDKKDKYTRPTVLKIDKHGPAILANYTVTTIKYFKEHVYPYKKKICSICKKLKDIKEYGKQPMGYGGYRSNCHECRKMERRGYFSLAMDMYSKQKLRERKNSIKYKVSYSKEEFIEYITKKSKYKKLYKKWLESDYATDLKPSIDRKNSNKGYSFNNIQIITWKDNNIKGRFEKFKKPITQYSLDGVYIKTFKSVKDANLAMGSKYMKTGNAANNNNTAGGYRWKWR